MVTIEEQRAQAVSKLAELNKIPAPRYSARDLHQKRAMLARVQRKEKRRYMGNVCRQKTKLAKDISDIDAYTQSVSEYDTYLTSLQQPVNGGNGGGDDISSITLIHPVAPTVLPAPTIVFGPKPVLTRTKLKRYQRRSKY